MDSLKPISINDLINSLPKSRQFDFSKTKTIYNDFWYIWFHSGLLEFVCQNLRNKYLINILDASKDVQFPTIYMGGDDTIDLIGHVFFDNWSRKNEFQTELYKIIKQLRLHKDSYVYLFDRIFYDDKLEEKTEFSGYDNDAVETIFEFGEEKELIFLGFPYKEVKKYEAMIRAKLKRHKIPLTTEVKKEIQDYINKLGRNFRKIQNKELYVEVIKQMQHYKKWVEVDELDWAHEDDKIKQFSEKCATRISTNLLEFHKIDMEFTGIAFRRLAARLYKEYPILRDFTRVNK